MTVSGRADQLNQALELMYFGFRGLVDAPDRLLARRGLGRMHHRVLYFIAREPGLSVGDLLGRLAITKQALHRPLRDLQARRLVTTTADRNDRRVRRLVLTKGGAALEDRLSGMQRAHLARIFAGAGRPAESGWRSVMKRMARDDGGTVRRSHGQTVRRPNGLESATPATPAPTARRPATETRATGAAGRRRHGGPGGRGEARQV